MLPLFTSDHVHLHLCNYISHKRLKSSPTFSNNSFIKPHFLQTSANPFEDSQWFTKLGVLNPGTGCWWCWSVNFRISSHCSCGQSHWFRPKPAPNHYVLSIIPPWDRILISFIIHVLPAAEASSSTLAYWPLWDPILVFYPSRRKYGSLLLKTTDRSTQI